MAQSLQELEIEKSLQYREYWVRELFGNTAVVATVLQFLSGVLVCKQYVVKKSTLETPSLPFICGFISCTIWLHYGRLKSDHKIIFVNVIGGLLSLIYTGIYYVYTSKKSVIVKQLVAVIIFLMLVETYSVQEIDKEVLVKRTGLTASVLTLMFISAPLIKLKHVFVKRSTECLPFPMILMAFVVSSLWYIYGLIVSDGFLQVTNFIGAVLSAAQLALFAMFPSRRAHSKGVPEVA